MKIIGSVTISRDNGFAGRRVLRARGGSLNRTDGPCRVSYVPARTSCTPSRQCAAPVRAHDDDAFMCYDRYDDDDDKTIMTTCARRAERHDVFVITIRLVDTRTSRARETDARGVGGGAIACRRSTRTGSRTRKRRVCFYLFMVFFFVTSLRYRFRTVYAAAVPTTATPWTECFFFFCCFSFSFFFSLPLVVENPR